MKRTIMVALSLSASTVLLSASGCSSALRAATRRGDDALARGDRSGAIVAYREACRMDATADACGLAKQLAQAELREVLMRAEVTCAAPGQSPPDAPAAPEDPAGAAEQAQRVLRTCLDTLAPARRLSITSPALEQVLAGAATRHLAACNQLDTSGTGLDAAAARMACLLSPLQAIDLPSYTDQVRAIGRESATPFARAADLAKETGARWAFVSVAQCFDPQLDTRAVRSAFVREAAVPIAVGADTTQVQGAREPFADLCPRVAEGLGGRALCAPFTEARERGLAIDAGITMAPASETATTTVQSLDYIAGTEMALNPYFEPAERRYRDAQRAFQEIEQETRDRYAACDTFRDTARCNAYKAIVPTYWDRQRERDNAARALDQTPRTYVRQVRDTFRYDLDTHRWHAPWSFTLTGAIQTTQSGVAWYTDTVHVGFDRAQLAPDPLVPPSAETLKQVVAKELIAALVLGFDSDLTRDARAAGRDCTTAAWDPTALSCWERSQHLAAQTPGALEVLTRAGHAVGTCL